MTLFVHITDKSNQKKIRRDGLKPERKTKCLFCVPSTGDFMLSHQWSRELKRFGVRQALAIYFRVPKTKDALFGHYNGPYKRITAGEAARRFRELENSSGYEVIFQSRISPRSIVKTIALRRPVGWRYYPAAKHNRMYWPNRGSYRAKQLRRQIERCAEWKS